MDLHSLGIRLFGYNIGDVNEELSNIDREYYESLKDIELKTQKYTYENQRLKDEILALKQKNENNNLQPIFLEAAIKGADKFIELYKEYVSGETGRLKENEQNMLRLYKEKIGAIEEEIKNAKQILEKAVNNIFNNSNAEFSPAESNKVPVNIPKFQGEVSSVPEQNFNYSLPSYFGPIPKIEYISHEQNKSPEYQTLGDERELESFKPFEPASMNSENLSAAPLSAEGADNDIKTNGISQKEDFPQPIIDKMTQAGKLIIGKKVSEDLFDFNGNLIIQKDQRITEKTLFEADRARKLSELIINVAISELPDIPA